MILPELEAGAREELHELAPDPLAAAGPDQHVDVEELSPVRVVPRRDDGVQGLRFYTGLRMAGFELRRVQKGLQPTDWKPMTGVGAGVQEIRIHTGQEHRVFYVARFEEGVYVLHAFEKRSRKTPAREIEVARARVREVLATRRRVR